MTTESGNGHQPQTGGGIDKFTGLDKLVSNPKFKEGYSDGEKGKPRADYSRVYLVGYDEGAFTAAICAGGWRTSPGRTET